MRILLAVVSIGILAAAALGLESRSRPEELMVHNKAHHLALVAFSLYEFPVERRPRIVWNYDDDWEIGALADCEAWTLTLKHKDVINSIDIVLQKLLPHEYGHFVHCHLHNGQVGIDPHGLQWQIYVTELGGDPNYY